MKCMIGTWFYSEKTQSNFEKKKKTDDSAAKKYTLILKMWMKIILKMQ